MSQFARQLRTPEERVGMLPNASLPPPSAAGEATARDDDALLLSALRDRDERAFTLMLDRYYPAMLRLAMTHVRSRASAEEIVQETWMAGLRGITAFEGRSAVKTWLFRILRNLARTRGRQEARMLPFVDLDADDAQDGASGGHPAHHSASITAPDAMWVRASATDAQLMGNELRAQLERALAALPARQREVIILRDVEGWSAEEVCNAMAITQTNQRVMLHRARDRVRNAIRGYLDENGGCPDEDERTDLS